MRYAPGQIVIQQVGRGERARLLLVRVLETARGGKRITLYENTLGKTVGSPDIPLFDRDPEPLAAGEGVFAYLREQNRRVSWPSMSDLQAFAASLSTPVQLDMFGEAAHG